MKVCLIYNASDRRCGFVNYGQQTETALRRAAHDLTVWDGTYEQVYGRQQLPTTPYLGMFPPDVLTYDVVHTIWHAMTLNHYAGAPWEQLAGGPLLSWIDGGPSNASCPFKAHMQVRWGHYPRPIEEAYHVTPLPIPDWVTDLPRPNPSFTVGATSVRGDGVEELRQVCVTHGWQTNLPQPGQWLSVEDEIRRLARSSVNVCWYDTPPLWKDRAGAPSTALASRRPLLITDDSLLGHLWGYTDLYHGRLAVRGGPDLSACLTQITADHAAGTLNLPWKVLEDFSWTSVTTDFTRVWEEARHDR